MEYSIDIAYYTTDTEDDDAVNEIANKYNDCKWYARDTTFGKNIKSYVSNGYIIKSLDTLKNIIKKVNDHKYLWVNFCTKTINKDMKRIYSSPTSLSENGQAAKKFYITQVAKFTGDDKEVNDLCVVGE